MKHIIALLAVAFVASASAQDTAIKKLDMGTGVPSQFANQGGVENATLIGSNNIYHVPQYLPGSPTAATIYPRILRVKCEEPAAGKMRICEGYQWSPEMGRGEYLFVETANVPPQVQEKVVEKIVEVPGPERVILREVPPKKKRE